MAHAPALAPDRQALPGLAEREQPQPLTALVGYSETVDGIESHLSRTWEPYEVGLCSRCPRCAAVGAHCQIQVNTRVEPGDAARFSVVAWLAGVKPPIE